MYVYAEGPPKNSISYGPAAFFALLPSTPTPTRPRSLLPQTQSVPCFTTAARRGSRRRRLGCHGGRLGRSRLQELVGLLACLGQDGLCLGLGLLLQLFFLAKGRLGLGAGLLHQFPGLAVCVCGCCRVGWLVGWLVAVGGTTSRLARSTTHLLALLSSLSASLSAAFNWALACVWRVQICVINPSRPSIFNTHQTPPLIELTHIPASPRPRSSAWPSHPPHSGRRPWCPRS